MREPTDIAAGRETGQAWAGRSHAAFFEEIASRAKRDIEWTSVAAGLAALRACEGRSITGSASDWGLARIAEMVAQLARDDSLRGPLERLALDLADEESVAQERLTQSLMTYARALEDSAQWLLAVDVYRTVLRINSDVDIAINCLLRIGQCHRNVGTLSNAARAFRKAKRLARRMGHTTGVLQAEIGFTHLDLLRGNLPRARRRNARILKRTRALGLRDLQSRALHDRSGILMLRGKHEEALAEAYAALALSGDRRHKERILFDIGGVLAKRGLHEAARYVYRAAAIQGQEKVMRWSALGNLLEIASDAGDADEFKRCSGELDRESLPPFLAACIHLASGVGYLKFGDPVLGSDHLRSAIAVASEHGYNQVVIEAEEALKSLQRQAGARKAADGKASRLEDESSEPRRKSSALSRSNLTK